MTTSILLEKTVMAEKRIITGISSNITIIKKDSILENNMKLELGLMLFVSNNRLLSKILIFLIMVPTFLLSAFVKAKKESNKKFMGYNANAKLRVRDGVLVVTGMIGASMAVLIVTGQWIAGVLIFVLLGLVPLSLCIIMDRLRGTKGNRKKEV
ncbi:MAG: hypothetical protein GY749_18450 [Desulfobacteraceae bacterium]|nr:hypothetical protein [Desulfobacteraceae bacterium]